MCYTGDTLGEEEDRRRAVAIEPMTCPPNALRTGEGVIELEEGEKWHASWGITSALD
jgi:aldose 1-epimerase